MSDPRSLSSLLRYLNAPPARRGGQVQSLRNQDDSAYSPGRDFWLPIRRAISADRRTTRDGSAVRAAAANASPKRRSCYDNASRQWDAIMDTWSDSVPVKLEPVVIQAGGLALRVSANFAELCPNGEREAVLVWMNKALLSTESVTAAQVALVRAFPEHRPVVVDLPRSLIHAGEAVKLAPLGAWLDAEAAGLAHLLAEAA